MAYELRLLSNFGAEVLGLDLSRPLDDITKNRLYRDWLEHGVMLFRGIGTTVERHVELSRCFGDLEILLKAHQSVHVNDHPELIAVSNPEHEGRAYCVDGEFRRDWSYWHADNMDTPTIMKGAVLRMVETPAEGGETAWIDTVMAYDALPEATKRCIENLEVRHRFRSNIEGVRFGLPASVRMATMEEVPFVTDWGSWSPDPPDVIHPLVIVHPETKRKSLGIGVVSLVSIVDMSPSESDSLLNDLVTHTLRDEFMFQHRWKPNDMVIWDNRRTIHRGMGYPLGQQGKRRYALRTTLAGGMNSGRLAGGNQVKGVGAAT